MSKVENMGDDYTRVFKVILLLNALTVKFKSSPEKYAPNDKNLKYIFSGDRCEGKMDNILCWLDETQIITRDIFGELRILDTIFVFIIPFTENDKYDFVDEKECRIFLEMLRNQYGRYETENFSSIVPRKIEEQCVISKQFYLCYWQLY